MEQVKVSKEIEMLKETVENCYVDCSFSIEEGNLPETNKQSEIFNQWEKNVITGDFFNADLFVGVDIVEGLPRLNITDNPEKYSINLLI